MREKQYLMFLSFLLYSALLAMGGKAAHSIG
jgi:hypothetical protein